MYRENFTDAYEVRIAQLTALVAEKKLEIEKAKQVEDGLAIKLAEGETHFGAVFDQTKSIEQLIVEQRGFELMLDRELRRKDNPEFLANLAKADEALLACDENAFNKRFADEISPKLAEAAKLLGQCFVDVQRLTNECREPFLQAKRKQALLGGIRILPDDAGLYPTTDSVTAHFRAAFESMTVRAAGEYSREISWCIFSGN